MVNVSVPNLETHSCANNKEDQEHNFWIAARGGNIINAIKRIVV